MKIHFEISSESEEYSGYHLLFEMPNMHLVPVGFNVLVMDPLGYNCILEYSYIP